MLSKTKLAGMAAGLAVVGFFVTPYAEAKPTNAATGARATGGGQFLVPTNGAGSTLGFAAISTASGTDEDAAKGQLQVIDRCTPNGNDPCTKGGSTGRDQVKYHGEVQCLVVVDDASPGADAYISGVLTKFPVAEDPADQVTHFALFVRDNGEGASNTTGDQVVFTPTIGNPDTGSNEADDTCGVDAPAANAMNVVDRGNVQVRAA
jgi:hypothetical protein